MDWYWTRSSIRTSSPSGKKNKHSSSTRRITSRRRWGQNSSRDRDGILYSRESHAQESPGSKRAWSDQTTSCILQEKVESASRHDVLGRHAACSAERIEVLSNKVERSHPTRHTPCLLYLEGDCDEIWRSQKSESVCVTSTTTDDSYKDTWTCDLDSDIARSSNDIQRIELKPITQLSSTVKRDARWREESLERTKFDHDTRN